MSVNSNLYCVRDAFRGSHCEVLKECQWHHAGIHMCFPQWRGVRCLCRYIRATMGRYGGSSSHTMVRRSQQPRKMEQSASGTLAGVPVATLHATIMAVSCEQCMPHMHSTLFGGTGALTRCTDFNLPRQGMGYKVDIRFAWSLRVVISVGLHLVWFMFFALHLLCG